MTEVRHTWKQLACIQLGGVVGLPLLLIGFTAGQSVSLISGIIACLIGNALLMFLGLGLARHIVERRCTTSVHMQFILGHHGKTMMALLMVSSMICWFAIQTEVVSGGLFEEEGRRKIFCLIFSCVTACFLRKGLFAIERASIFLCPIIVCIMVMALFTPHTPFAHNGSFLFAISLLMGGAIFAVIDLPTFFHTAIDVENAKKGIIATFGCMIPIVEIIGIVLAQQGSNLLSVLSASAGGGAVTACVICSGSMVNMMNLYSATKAIEAVLPGCQEMKALCIAASLATFLTMVPILDHLGMIILLMATAAASCGGLLLSSAFFTTTSRSLNWVAIAMGVMMGTCEVVFQLSFTGLSLLDSFLFSFSIVTVGAIFFTKETSHVI